MSDIEPEAFDEFLGSVEITPEDYNLFDNVAFDEQVPEPSLEEDLPPIEEIPRIGDGSCRVCGAPTFRPPGLTKSGRKKRIPSLCDLHATNVQVPGGSSGSGRMEPQLRRVQEELADDIRLLGVLTGPLLPVTGMYLLEQADPFTIALVNLASKNQRLLRILHRAAQVAPIYTVGRTLAGTAYSVQVDIQKVDPHNMVGDRLGVSAAYDQVYPQEEAPVQSNGFRPAPRYSTVQ